MVIQLRGTHGCGKSTIVRTLMLQYDLRIPCTNPPLTEACQRQRKHPWGYRCDREAGPSLFVIGHYEIECGGGDTISKVECAYELIHWACAQHHDVIFEGILLAHDVRRCIELKTTHQQEVLVISLNTDLETCYQSVVDRRLRRGNTNPLKRDNVNAGRNSYLIHQPRRLNEAGIRAIVVDREEALRECQRVLTLPQVAPVLERPQVVRRPSQQPLW